jgi:hypothetical protein
MTALASIKILLIVFIDAIFIEVIASLEVIEVIEVIASLEVIEVIVSDKPSLTTFTTYFPIFMVILWFYDAKIDNIFENSFVLRLIFRNFAAKK